MMWFLLALLAASALAPVILPLRRTETRAARNVERLWIYRDQLAQLPDDINRGVIEAGQGPAARLEIEQETEDIGDKDPELGPTWTQRKLKTQVVVHDQQSVVIGGLIQERDIYNVTKVPLLGDIPILGYLFKYSTKAKKKTNLLILLTPYIVKDQLDLQAIRERKDYDCEFRVAHSDGTVRHVHSLGLKFGLYVTPGISQQAVAQNTAIEVTSISSTRISPTAFNSAGSRAGASHARCTSGVKPHDM